MTVDHTLHTPSALAAELADDARIALGRVRAAWPHLAAARLPGTRTPAVDRPITARMRARAAEQAKLDRAAAVEAHRWGRKIGGPHPAPGNLTPIQTRADVARELAALAGRMWTHRTGTALVLLMRDPAGRDSVWCTWCHGTGEAQPPYGWQWPWPTPPPACSRCTGTGRVAAGVCLGCGSSRSCGCDRADVTTTAAIAAVADLLDTAGVEAAADAESTLLDVADLAERTLNTTGPVQVRLAYAECPACGGRELHAETGSPNPREWAVRCAAADCRCTGPAGVVNGVRRPACLCGIATARRAERAHCWPARTWDGPRGLAALLGVTLPGTERRQP